MENDVRLEVVRQGLHTMRIERRAEMPVRTVLDLLKTKGALLKQSKKAETTLVGPFVVKRGRGRNRRAWAASWHLERAQIPVAAAYAYVEHAWLGFVTGNAFLSAALVACCTVEEHAAKLVRGKTDSNDVAEYLARIAALVNRLTESGAHHADLSGKNILTRDGLQFWLIDLDSVVMGKPYTDRLRLKNHVQLYDSFCDLWGDDVLVPFLQAMLPPETDVARWMEQVRKRQLQRRLRTVRAWAIERERSERGPNRPTPA
ncbi:MAG TPA: lipopolysaccharide kinase InaA family protein [Candidatus Hydrogenedentes bacterium]|nr:lipopolysaccharide kinase InaA family protein [Candidatus Hydrogenedentota bacterium]HOS03548.1 lipopolysaccharide kinase InaA family protein [Candidatus Hydrogenedentota bacterium]